jgi:hypothetical protein
MLCVQTLCSKCGAYLGSGDVIIAIIYKEEVFKLNHVTSQKYDQVSAQRMSTGTYLITFFSSAPWAIDFAGISYPTTPSRN